MQTLLRRAPSAPTQNTPIRKPPPTLAALPVRCSLPPRQAPPRPLRARCAAEGGGSLPDLVSEQVEALLQREENRNLLEGLEEASRRVEAARRALADIERQEEEAARAKEIVLQLQRRESQIVEFQKELLEAKAMVEEAEQTLLSDFSDIGSGEIGGAAVSIDTDLERLESAKAAVISSVVGVLASLPISLYETTTSFQLFQHLLVVFISSALFGVTFRYTVRRDLDNIQLKIGTSGAFGFVQGLAALDAAMPLDTSASGLISHVFDGAVYISTSTLVFLFSSVALDFCFKTGLLSPFPMRK